MDYICLKPLALGGVEYKPGDIISFETVLPARERPLKSYGYIAAANAGVSVLGGFMATAAPAADDGDSIEIPIKGAGEEMFVSISKDTAAFVLSLLQETVEEAAAMIQSVEDENTLILIHATDSRKGVKNAAKERASSLRIINDANAGPTASQQPIMGDNA